MNRRLSPGSEPLAAPAGLDLELVAQLAPSLPPERAARMIEQRLESWHPGDALSACQQALETWLAPPLPQPLAITPPIRRGRR